MSYLRDFFFGHEVTRDQLGKRGGNPRFTPPSPHGPVGSVDAQGVMVTQEMWDTYEKQKRGDWTS